MTFNEAQRDMRNAYLGGGSGVLTSSIVWITAGIFAIYTSKEISFIVFFIGGMLIHPVGILIDKLFKRSGKHLKENPLGNLALESTIILFIGIYLVYALFHIQPDWLYPIMLMIIGVRYLVFQTIYGMKIYWLLGGTLIAAGFTGLNLNQPFYTFGIIGGLIEFLFSIMIIKMEKTHSKDVLTHN